MGARSKARKRAVDVLFEADQRDTSPLAVLATRGTRSDVSPNPYTSELVEGVVAHLPAIDALLVRFSVDWPVERMPAVDRAVLRLALFELLWVDDVPDAVVIDEAVVLTKELSTDESPGFVNGLLGHVVAQRAVLDLDPPASPAD